MGAVPHSMYLTVVRARARRRPSSGPDQTRQYAAKCCSKPEPWYFLETEKNGLKDWLKARTVGLCMAFNRIMHFHVVRSTRPVQWQPVYPPQTILLRAARPEPRLAHPRLCIRPIRF